MPNFNPALLLLAAASPQAAANAHPETAAKVRCEVALSHAKDVLTEYRDRQLVFGVGDPDLFDAARSGWWTDGSERPTPAPPPPPDLEARLYAEGNTGAVEHCRTVRNLLDSRGLLFGKRAARSVRSENRRGNYGSAVVHISLPVVSEDGRQAILAFSHSGAGASLLLLQREGEGRWRAVARRPLSVY
jgi:hypothetical protein